MGWKNVFVWHWRARSRYVTPNVCNTGSHWHFAPDTQAVQDNRSLEYCFNNSTLWDIEVLVGGRKIFANRAVLSARSSVFRELLDPQLTQKIKAKHQSANNTNNSDPLHFDNVNLSWFSLTNSTEVMRPAKDFLKLTDNGFVLEISDFSYEVIYALVSDALRAYKTCLY